MVVTTGMEQQLVRTVGCLLLKVPIRLMQGLPQLTQVQSWHLRVLQVTPKHRARTKTTP